MTSRLDSFIEHLRDRQRRPGTIDRYQEAVTSYLASGLDPASWIKRPQANGEPISPSAFNGRRSALRAWFKYTNEEVSLPEARKISRPGIQTLEPEQITRFLEAFNSLPLREQAAALLLYGAGLRRFELIGAQLDNLDLVARLIQVEGKGGDLDRVPFPRDTAERLQRYILEERRPSKSGPQLLFVGDRGGSYDEKKLVKTIRQAYRAAGIEWAAETLRPVHLIRHCFATDMAEGGTETTKLQALLRHKDPRASMIYVHLNPRALRRQIDEAHPLSKKQPLSIVEEAA